jgi:hypothetical protein
VALFALSDLHLPLGNYKPMDVFGSNWNNYVERIREGWTNTVGNDDVVIVNGDFCWATYLDDAVPDFKFLASLPGVKLLSKGNHDYWWETAKKMNEFLEKNSFENIYFIHNSSYMYEGYAICASRGWICPGDRDYTAADEKMYKRELGRLKMSLEAGLAKKPKGLIAALHYPPGEGFDEILDSFDVKECVYGHLHGKSAFDHKPKKENYHLVSADFLQFTPMKINI